jgi:hypothetical protein
MRGIRCAWDPGRLNNAIVSNSCLLGWAGMKKARYCEEERVCIN